MRTSGKSQVPLLLIDHRSELTAGECWRKIIPAITRATIEIVIRVLFMTIRA